MSREIKWLLATHSRSNPNCFTCGNWSWFAMASLVKLSLFSILPWSEGPFTTELQSSRNGNGQKTPPLTEALLFGNRGGQCGPGWQIRGTCRKPFSPCGQIWDEQIRDVTFKSTGPMFTFFFLHTSTGHFVRWDSQISSRILQYLVKLSQRTSSVWQTKLRWLTHRHLTHLTPPQFFQWRPEANGCFQK